MSEVWVDTDFGFDDLWALLLLRHLGCDVAGVSLVAGNAPLDQVAENAAAATRAYGFNWPAWRGAAKPVARSPETAARILGPTGMRSRGRQLEPGDGTAIPDGAVAAMGAWLGADPTGPKEVLALGPLTNIALLLRTSPKLAQRIHRIAWMGGSTGPGNHTAKAEFNAVADAEALADVLASGIRVNIIDLMFCRSVTFSETDIATGDPLTRDLLGGYLDIALERGRTDMAIYDPLAALAIAQPGAITFSFCDVAVSTDPGETYGETTFSMTDTSHLRVASTARGDLARTCLDALQGMPARV